MQRAAKTSRFLIDLSSSLGFSDSEGGISLDGLLQHIVVSRLAGAANSRQAFKELGYRLIRLAEHAFILRDISALQILSQVLTNLPIADVRQIGQYYQALAVSRIGPPGEALSLLEAVAENGPLAYRARAFQTLGSIYHRLEQREEALRFYPEALRAASPENGGDPLTVLLTRLEISCLRSETGDHKGALADLESLSPFVRLLANRNPLYFYCYHNELAFELGELGRIAEAQAACAIALASPFAPAYPEWSATRDEIAAKRFSATPSIVAVNRAPEADTSQRAQPEHRAVAVCAFAFTWPARTATFQRSLIPIAASRAITNIGIIRSILDRMLSCIGPRAPPALV